MSNLLITNKKYNSEANELAQKIALQTRARHAKWLVSLKYILDQSDVDGALSRQSEFCDSVILKEEERITENQRLLLECESSKVKERRKAIEERQKVFGQVVDDIAEHAEKTMVERLSKMTPLQLFGKFPDFSYFLSVAYSPSLTFPKLSVLTTNDHQLKSNVLALVNNPKFCGRLGKTVRNQQDPIAAIGTLGIDNCSLLFPILMAKPLLRWHDPVTKSIAPKLWQHMILTANVTRLRLEQANFKNPQQGILLGVLRTISHFAIVNHFSQLFEDAQIEKMQSYREKNMREEYYACAEIKPELSILPSVISRLEQQLTQKVVDAIEWTPFTFPLKNALQEDLDNIAVIERSEAGVALAQAQAYAMFDTLDRSGVFVEKHKPFWFANVQMPPDALLAIRDKHPGMIDLAR
ncbi:HDOD domain-containing protein [Vibrio sinaloensis]|uniref:HDOD domain-containing protein n=1 Tax=Photobacterium sp. (strain ATCC 43367) TaxID=379097 RepID=UPI0022AF6FFD|nr:HDOD domain-containing protein [Vibrio sinaloensis]MCZ4294512.1 HDOD domain-containing protein [Vibrio sinaloensis]